MYFLLKIGIFHCYVSLPEGISINLHPYLREVPGYPNTLFLKWVEIHLEVLSTSPLVTSDPIFQAFFSR